MRTWRTYRLGILHDGWVVADDFRWLRKAKFGAHWGRRRKRRRRKRKKRGRITDADGLGLLSLSGLDLLGTQQRQPKPAKSLQLLTRHS